MASGGATATGSRPDRLERAPGGVDVVHVLPHARTLGGTERAVLDLLESPELAGVRQRVVFVQAGPHVGFRRHHLLCGPSPLWSPLAAVRAIARARPAVIHGWLLQGNVVGAAARAFTPRSRLIASERNVGDALSPLKRAFELVVAAQESVVTANSEAVRDAAVRRLPRRNTAARLVPPGLASPVRPARVVGTDAVMVGRIDPVKDYACALRAWARVVKARAARLTIVGDGSERGAIEDLARALRVDDSVTFVGDADPRPFLFGARVFVQSSLAEGFSRALIEALMAGLPAVVTDVGGVRELSAGVVRVVPSGESEPLAAAVEAVLDDPRALRRARDEAGRVAAQFSLERSCRAYRELYRELGVV